MWQVDCTSFCKICQHSAVSLPGAFVLRDGFQVIADRFDLAIDTTLLDPKAKRSLTVCNLFLNHGLSISDIARLLDEGHEQVISILVHHKVIKDRRRVTGRPPGGFDRRRIRRSVNVGADDQHAR